MPKSRRKNKLNEDLISEASRLVKAGLHLSHVAQALGISRQTFYNWLRKGEETQKGMAQAIRIQRMLYDTSKEQEAVESVMMHDAIKEEN